MNYDILDLHSKILKNFENEYESLPLLSSELENLKLNPDNISYVDDKINQLTKKIIKIETGRKQALYIVKTEIILEKYKNIINEPIKINFMNNIISENKLVKDMLIVDYLKIAKDYINIKFEFNNKTSLNCPDCKIKLFKKDEYLFLCTNCGFSIKHFANTCSFQENNRINISQRYVYDKRAHFGDSIKKFQAKQNTTIHKNVYDTLLDKIKKHQIPLEKLSHKHIYEFLKLTNFSDHYEDITLIYSEITNTPAPDITHLEEKLFKLFDEIDPIYERVKPKGRVNFLNGQFLLFKLLQKLKFPCSEEDFCVLKTRDKMLEHDQIWKKICTQLCWNYIATV